MTSFAMNSCRWFISIPEKLGTTITEGFGSQPTTRSNSSTSSTSKSSDSINGSKSKNKKDIEKNWPGPVNIQKNQGAETIQHSWRPTNRFRLSFALICFIFILSAFEASVVGNALPSIASDLSLGNSYIWGSIGFLLASTIIQPVYAQVIDVFGRKKPLQVAIVVFAVGSVCCAAAHGKVTFLIGRVTQGMGVSGIDLIGETILGDLVPLCFRPKWYGIKQAVYAAGTLLGPVLGGVFTERVSWRWVFWMNVPMCFVSTVLIWFFLRVEEPSLSNWHERFAKVCSMDLGGISLLTLALICLTVSLTDSNALGNALSISEFAIGCSFFISFILWEIFSPWCREPFMPSRLWRKARTSLLGFFNIFVWGALAYGTQLVLPIHLQAVKGDDPMKAGYEMLPITALLVVFSWMSGELLSRFGSRKGTYKWMQLIGFLLQTLGSALLTLLNANSTAALVFSAMIICAMGSGIAVPAILPSVVIELKDADNAVATGNWAFLRNLGAVAGSLLPAMYLNYEALSAANDITDLAVKQELLKGGIWNEASAEFMSGLPPITQPIVKDMFSSGLRWTFVTFAVAAGLSALLTLIMKSLSMRVFNETAFGLQSEHDTEAGTKGEDSGLDSA